MDNIQHYILCFQAKIPEDEILGVRAPGLTPGFNAQYEVTIDQSLVLFTFLFHCIPFSFLKCLRACLPSIQKMTTFQVLIDYGFIWDSSQGVPPRATPVWPYTYDYKMPHK